MKFVLYVYSKIEPLSTEGKKNGLFIPLARVLWFGIFLSNTKCMQTSHVFHAPLTSGLSEEKRPKINITNRT